METTIGLQNLLQKILLSCGIIAALLYLGTDVLTGKRLKDYSFSVHSMSEMGAAGSPTRPLFVMLTLVASVFMIAFVVGIWQVTGPVLLPRIVAGLIAGHVVMGLVATLFFPNRFGVRPEFGTPGVLLMFISVLCFVLAMIFGAIAFNGWLRVLSIAIPTAYILLAILRFATAASSTAGATGLIGTQERTMAYSFLVWVMALAVHLLILSSTAADSLNHLGG